MIIIMVCFYGYVITVSVRWNTHCSSFQIVLEDASQDEALSYSMC